MSDGLRIAMANRLNNFERVLYRRTLWALAHIITYTAAAQLPVPGSEAEARERFVGT